MILGEGLINSKSLFKKILTFSEFITQFLTYLAISHLNLFHSPTEEERKSF